MTISYTYDFVVSDVLLPSSGHWLVWVPSLVQFVHYIQRFKGSNTISECKHYPAPDEPARTPDRNKNRRNIKSVYSHASTSHSKTIWDERNGRSASDLQQNATTTSSQRFKGPVSGKFAWSVQCTSFSGSTAKVLPNKNHKSRLKRKCIGSSRWLLSS